MAAGLGRARRAAGLNTEQLAAMYNKGVSEESFLRKEASMVGIHLAQVRASARSVGIGQAQCFVARGMGEPLALTWGGRYAAPASSVRRRSGGVDEWASCPPWCADFPTFFGHTVRRG